MDWRPDFGAEGQGVHSHAERGNDHQAGFRINIDGV
jgi:hypothetical protein